MNGLSLFVAILNCRLAAPEKDVASGIILIENGMIAAAGKDFLMALPADAVIIDAKGGQVGAGGLDADRPGAIQIGDPADLICRRPSGEIHWVMERGEMVYPPDAPPLRTIFWEMQRQKALCQAMNTLKQRQEHVHIQIMEDEEAGVDFLWRFRDGRGRSQQAGIRVVPALIPEPRQLLILDRDAARHWPETDMRNTRAHWWFFWHEIDGVFYCFPTPALRRWTNAHASAFPLATLPFPADPSPLQGRIIPLIRLQQDIPQLRVLPIQKRPGTDNA